MGNKRETIRATNLKLKCYCESHSLGTSDLENSNTHFMDQAELDRKTAIGKIRDLYTAIYSQSRSKVSQGLENLPNMTLANQFRCTAPVQK